MTSNCVAHIAPATSAGRGRSGDYGFIVGDRALGGPGFATKPRKVSAGAGRRQVRSRVPTCAYAQLSIDECSGRLEVFDGFDAAPATHHPVSAMTLG